MDEIGQDVEILTDGEDPYVPKPNVCKDSSQALIPPTPLMPLRDIRRRATAMRKEGMVGGKINFEVFISRYVELWQECCMGMERARRGKRIRPDRQDPITKKWIAQYKPDEGAMRAYISQAQSLLDALTKFRKEISTETVGMTDGMIAEIADALKLYPEARKAVLKKLDRSK